MLAYEHLFWYAYAILAMALGLFNFFFIWYLARWIKTLSIILKIQGDIIERLDKWLRKGS